MSKEMSCKMYFMVKYFSRINKRNTQIILMSKILRNVLSVVKEVRQLGVCAGRIGRVKANISIQSAISGLEKFQSATNPPKSKSGGLVTNFGGFNLAGYAG